MAKILSRPHSDRRTRHSTPRYLEEKTNCSAGLPIGRYVCDPSAEPSEITRAYGSFKPPAGKSSLLVQFIENYFVELYYPTTIEATFKKSVKYKGTEYECDIFDTAGQVSSRTILCHCPRHLQVLDLKISAHTPLPFPLRLHRVPVYVGRILDHELEACGRRPRLHPRLFCHLAHLVRNL